MTDTTTERQASHYLRMAAATAELAEWSDDPKIAATYRALEAHWLARVVDIATGAAAGPPVRSA